LQLPRERASVSHSELITDCETLEFSRGNHFALEYDVIFQTERSEFEPR
jgi:hypothetical protein